MSLGITVDSLNIARTWAVLTAAFDAAPTEILARGARWANLYCVYERGAASGAVDVRVEYSPFTVDRTTGAATNWYRATVEDIGVFAAGADVDADVQRRGIRTYESTAAGTETFVIGAIEIARGAERIRVACAESGDEQSPGECEVIVMLSDTSLIAMS